MSHGNQQTPAGPMAKQGRVSAAWDVSSQLLHTRQWEADGAQLLRPADFHAWAAARWATAQ